MSTPQDLQDLQALAAAFLAALARDTAAAAAEECLADIKSGKYKSTYLDQPYIVRLPKPQPNVRITVNLVGE